MRHAQRKSRQYDDLPRRKSATVTRARFYVSTFLRFCDPLVLVAAPAPAASRPRPPSSTDQFLSSLFALPCSVPPITATEKILVRKPLTRRDHLLRRYRLIFAFRSTDRTDSEFTGGARSTRQCRREEKRIGRRGGRGAAGNGVENKRCPGGSTDCENTGTATMRRAENDREKILKGNYSVLDANNRYRTLWFV